MSFTLRDSPTSSSLSGTSLSQSSFVSVSIVRESPIYVEDRIGLKALDEAGGLHFMDVEVHHLAHSLCYTSVHSGRSPAVHPSVVC